VPIRAEAKRLGRVRVDHSGGRDGDDISNLNDARNAKARISLGDHRVRL
jgi:hypothetical protein